MLGYINNKKANEETFDKDGWMRTGFDSKISSNLIISNTQGTLATMIRMDSCSSWTE